MNQSERIKLIEENKRLSAELEASRQEKMSVFQKFPEQMDKISALDNDVSSLKDQLYWSRKKVFGQMTEKTCRHGTKAVDGKRNQLQYAVLRVLKKNEYDK